ncbi:MAG: hypothetical protein Q7W30_00925 [Coriobacteriia bacterium]|nr:hypothetical protein [Coriobacteriia bacterium]
MNKVVARFADGRLVKGMTADFLPAKEFFHVRIAGSQPGEGQMEVRTKDLKALFFVKDLDGDPEHVEKKEFDGSGPSVARRIKVEFADGEVLVGTTMGYQPGRPGFFLEPADAESNIERCYIVAASTKDISFL